MYHLDALEWQRHILQATVLSQDKANPSLEWALPSLCKHALKFGRYRELRTAWNMHGPRFAVRYLRATW